MIKMLHLADLHIGVENYGRLDSKTGLHTRLLDYLARLDEIVALSQTEKVDLVVIAGDIYKSRSPNPTHQREFAQRVKQWRAAGVAVVLLTGNHDLSPAAGRASSIEIFRALEVEGVTIADRVKWHSIETRAGKVQIIAIPWITRHSLLTKDEMLRSSFSEIDAELRRKVERFIEDKLEKELDPTLPTVLAMHGTLNGAVFGAERQLTLGQDLVFSRSAIAQAGIDYVALGHIHRHQTLGEHPPVVYAGSIERIDFGEKDEDKGCVIVELVKNATRWRFQKLNARPFIALEVDVRTKNEPLERIAAAIRKASLQEAVVRLEIKATREQTATLRQAEKNFRTQLEEAGAFLVAAIVIETEKASQSRFSQAEKEALQSLNPRQVLELYLQSKDIAPDRITTLLDAANELINAGE